MLVFQLGQFVGRERLFPCNSLQPHFSATGGKQAAEQNVFFAADFDLDVLKFVVVSDGQVRRQRPRRRRPDEHERVRLADDGKLHVMLWLTWSWYSTSASASAVRQGMLQ